MDETISLKEILNVLLKRIKLIIVITLTTTLFATIFTMFFVTPTYEASSQFLVNQSTTQVEEKNYDVSDIRTNVELINTYNVIITSPKILNQVIEELTLDTSPGTLASNIKVNNASGSQVVNVSVTHTEPELAIKIANTTVSVFRDEISNLLNIDNVSVLSWAEQKGYPTQISPNLKLNIAIAFVLGIMISLGLAFLLEYLDTTIKSETELEEQLKLPVMGTIPKIDEEALRLNKNHRSKRKG